MLSFELSAIDLILALSVIILLVLYLTKLSTRPPTEQKPLVEKERPPEKPVTESTIVGEDEEKTMSKEIRPQTSSVTCPYGFGYLRKLDKEASIPDGCLGCSRIMECYSADE